MDMFNNISTYGQRRPSGDEEMADEEDFYGVGVNGSHANNNTLPGAAQNGTAQNVNGANLNKRSNNNSRPIPPHPYSSSAVLSATAEQKKLENQKKAEQLRAKLIANRQNTPARISTPNIAATKQEAPLKHAPPRPATAMEKPTKKEEVNTEQNGMSNSLVEDLDSLLADGYAAANAKAQAEDSAKLNASSNGEAKKAAEPKLAYGNQQQHQNKQAPVIHHNDEAKAPTQLTDPYYADLPMWLEVTGFHDVAYRDSKLRTHKERKSLEEEAVRIQDRLEKLRQTEEMENVALRASSAHPAATPNRPPPALPAFMPHPDGPRAGGKKPNVNGIKRVHSPEPMQIERNTRLREDPGPGFRIRGANGDSPDNRPPLALRGRAGSPLANDPQRRVSYPDPRRRNSHAELRGRVSRDPSLERRQSYYHRDGEGGPGRERDRFDPAYSLREDGGRGRMGFGKFNMAGEERGFREPYQAHARGSRILDLRKGDTRFFIIKSHNQENVTTAMRDSLWATQEKNELLLAEAYHNSRHVILFFSVNKSTNFQGMALMASPPDPSLPKPQFCARLNWSTSAAFKLHWLAQTSVHFRHVGHLKNEMNIGEDGNPMAVLVGKDGQEVSAAAGRGLCEILDEVEEVEGGIAHGNGNVNGKGGRGW